MLAPEQKKQSQPITKESDVSWREPGVDGNRRGRKHERARHLGRVDVYEIGYQCPCKRKHAEVSCLMRCCIEHNDSRSSHCCGRKEHCKKQQSASEKHSSKEAIFALPQAIT